MDGDHHNVRNCVKGPSIRKVENHCLRGSQEHLVGSRMLKELRAASLPPQLAAAS